MSKDAKESKPPTIGEASVWLMDDISNDNLLVAPDGIRSSDQGENSPSVTLRQVTIGANGGKGISASGGTRTATPSTVSGNQGGGISAMKATFDITNNSIYRNGNSTTSKFGSVSVQPMGTSRLEFNTIVDNEADAGTASAWGAFCDQPVFAAGDSLVFRNTAVMISRDHPAELPIASRKLRDEIAGNKARIRTAPLSKIVEVTSAQAFEPKILNVTVDGWILGCQRLNERNL
jgi:hypothetical protein